MTEICLKIFLLSFFSAGNNLQTAFFQEVAGSHKISFPANGNTVKSACRCLNSIGIDLSCSAIRNYNSMNSRAFSRAAYSSKVAHISNAVKNKNQGCFASFKHMRNNRVQMLVCNRRNKANHFLVVHAGIAVKCSVRNFLPSNIVLLQKLFQFMDAFTLCIVVNKD